MKKHFSFLFLFALLVSFRPKTEVFTIQPNFSDKQISEVVNSVLLEYEVKINIEIIKRNSVNEIEHLICKRFDTNGNLKSSCSSDSFGKLEITRTGCRIFDKGYN